MRKGATTMGTGESPPPTFGIQVMVSRFLKMKMCESSQRSILPRTLQLYNLIAPTPEPLVGWKTSAVYNFCPLPSYLRRGRAPGCIDYVSTCGVSLMPVVYQVVGFGRDDGSHSGRHGRRQRSVIGEGWRFFLCVCLQCFLLAKRRIKMYVYTMRCEFLGPE